MIPKIIHYCWFGNKDIPALESKCIATWNNVLHDYEFKLWNEKSFDINSSIWCRGAYNLRKYAFVADYVRLKCLYDYGGIYLDTDVKMLKSFNPLLEQNGFLCFEDVKGEVIATCVIGVEAKNPLIKELLGYYEQDFSVDIVNTFSSNALMFAQKFQCHGLKLNGLEQIIQGIHIYPRTYFCPMDYFSNWDKTKNTYCVHMFSGSWLPNDEKKKLDGRRKLWWRIGKYAYVHFQNIAVVRMLHNCLKNKKIID